MLLQLFRLPRELILGSRRVGQFVSNNRLAQAALNDNQVRGVWLLSSKPPPYCAIVHAALNTTAEASTMNFLMFMAISSASAAAKRQGLLLVP